MLSFDAESFFWKEKLKLYASMSSEDATQEAMAAKIAELEIAHAVVSEELSGLIRRQIRALQARQAAAAVELESLIETRRWLF